MRLFSVVRKRLNRRAEISRIIRRGKRRFSADARFDLDFAEQGFAPRAADGADDTVLFRRICEAWSKAMERQPSAPEAFQPHPWWDEIRQKSLGPITRALAAHDLDSLRRMYRNFFRDPCSTGVTGLPLGRIQPNSRISKIAKELCLIDGLHRIDVCSNYQAGG